MKIHLLSGFLGSGKTTAIQHASRVLLEKGIKTGIITNDQGIKLVDGDFFKSLGVPGRQVMNGCFCCNYNDLENHIASLEETNGTEVIFAESVGSCTDIVATVLKPLLRFHPEAVVTVSTIADVRLLKMMLLDGKNLFDETVRYIYLKQLEEAGIIVISKIDLVDEMTLNEVKLFMYEKYGNKILLYQNSFNKANILYWLQTINDERPTGILHSLDINYDIYAAGEACLAWLDEELEIFSADNNALQQVMDLVNTIYAKITARQFAIGHLKFLINGKIKINFTAGGKPFPGFGMEPAARATLLINIRVQTGSEILKQLVEESIQQVEIQSACRIVVHSAAAFHPGYPIPTYRIEN